MYIWQCSTDTKWSYHDIDDPTEIDEETYTVAADTFEVAAVKVRKLALAKSRAFYDDENFCVGTWHWIEKA